MVANKSTTKESVIINSIDRALDITEYIYLAGGEVSISQISKDLNIYKSTVFRTLATLENRGYVVQNPITELYSIGPKLFAYSANKRNDVLATSIKPYMKRLSDKYLELVTVSVLTKNARDVYVIDDIAKIKSQLSLSPNYTGTSQNECYCSSMGKCLLAFTPDLDLSIYNDTELKKFTDNTITTYDGLLAELEQIRKQGYAVDNEEREIGLFCLGVPIMSGSTAVAAMSISGPSSRIRDNNLEEKIATMKALSKEISSDIML